MNTCPLNFGLDEAGDGRFFLESFENARVSAFLC